jgi:hypothetical protein
MPKITYVEQGRFGNNIMQYIACKVLCELLNNDKHQPLELEFTYTFGWEHIQPWLTVFQEKGSSLWAKCNTSYSIYEWNRFDIDIKSYYTDVSVKEDSMKDILLHGYFQDFEFINRYHDFIKSLFTPLNADLVTPRYRMNEIIQPEHAIKNIDDITIVIHIRLDDFYNAGNQSNVLSQTYYIDALEYIKDKSIPIDAYTLWIVMDTLRNPKEHSYMNHLIQCFQNKGISKIMHHQKSELEDWNFCKNAKRFISSNSTFAWTAMIAGQMSHAVIPITHYYGGQYICSLNHIPNCYVLNASTVN